MPCVPNLSTGIHPYEACANLELPLSRLPCLKKRIAARLISIAGPWYWVPFLLAEAGARTERRHGERNEAQQRAGPLVTQGCGEVGVSFPNQSPLFCQCMEASESKRHDLELTVVHLNTK